MNFDAMKDLMDRLTSWRIPGNAICVWKDGREVFRYLGYRGDTQPDPEVSARIDACEAKLQEAADPRSLIMRFPVCLLALPQFLTRVA